MPVHLLSEHTINKIAAGEVVERPANAAKELIENALDAGATAITVELRGAGRVLLRISDNGAGMSREDLTMAVQRHATSKIHEFEDLGTLQTFGFRGEALSSIAAVSKFSIRSRQAKDSNGWQLTLNGGALKDSRACAMSVGTTVEVANLFFNTPARAKFLKSDTTEKHRILRMIEELALAWPGVAFTVIVEGKTVMSASRSVTTEERLRDILGGELSGRLLPVRAAHPSITVTGFVTGIEHSVSSKDTQYLFVNNRPVNPGKAFTHSIYHAYRERLPVGRHPGFVLFISIDPANIDVNIHPTKREVRFAHESEIYQLLSAAIGQTITRAPAMPTAFTMPPQASHQSARPVEKAVLYPHAQANRPDPALPSLMIRETPVSANPGTDYASGNAPIVLGQIFNLYIAAQRGDELLLIDQHAAHERIRYEAYRRDFEAESLQIQPLLLPVTIELSASQSALITENSALLQSLGCELEPFGKHTVRLTALPAILGTATQAHDLIGRIIDALSAGTRVTHEEKIEAVIRAACHASVKQHDRLAHAEMTRLITDLLKCAMPFTCPHGRPTMRTVSRAELERYFGRS